MSKPKINLTFQASRIKDIPDGTYYAAGHLVSSNAAWRSIRPCVDSSKCVGCMQCYLYCPDGAIDRIDGKVAIDYTFCKGCGICAKICKFSAIHMEEEKT